MLCLCTQNQLFGKTIFPPQRGSTPSTFYMWYRMAKYMTLGTGVPQEIFKNENSKIGKKVSAFWLWGQGEKPH